jgi:hypothetical protein
MKKIGKFLFVEQCFTDTEETKPCIIHIDAIDCITYTNISGLGEVVVIETDNTKILCNDPDNFFTEFENLISSEEEEW